MPQDLEPAPGWLRRKGGQPFFRPLQGFLGPLNINFLGTFRRIEQGNNMMVANLGIAIADRQMEQLTPLAVQKVTNPYLR